MAAVFRSILAALLLSSIASLAAQTITLIVSPVAPPDEWVNARTLAAPHVATAFRLEATATAEVTGLVLTCGGSGDWTTDLDPADGVAIWLDDGDGMFDALTDVLLYQGTGAPSVQALFSSVLTVNAGNHADLWIVLTFVQGAGFGASAAPETYELAVASTANVLQTQTSAATAVLGTPPPEATVSLLDFFVTSFNPLTGPATGGGSVTIDGSGFVLPIAVWVGGILCPGVVMVTGSTQVTGILIPPGGGSDLPITITSGFLPPITISQRFSYNPLPPPPLPPSTLIEIVTTSMPPAEVGKPYEATIRCTGGTGSYTWGSGLSAGALPNGLALQPSSTDSVKVAGTPTESGRFDVLLGVYDDYSGSEKWFSLTIFPAGKGGPLHSSDGSSESGCSMTGATFTWQLLILAVAVALCGGHRSRQRHQSQ